MSAMPLTNRPYASYGPSRPGSMFDVAMRMGWDWVERLSPEVFGQLAANRMYPEAIQRQHPRPVAVVMYPRADHNGAFLQGPMQALMRAYHVMYYELADDAGLAACMTDAARAGPASLVYVGGHGSPRAIALGKNFLVEETQEVDLRDEEQLRAAFKTLLPGGILVLDSCSTGRGGPEDNNMVSMFARLAPQAHVLAPMVDTSPRTHPVLDPTGYFLHPGFLDAFDQPAPIAYVPPTVSPFVPYPAPPLWG